MILSGAASQATPAMHTTAATQPSGRSASPRKTVGHDRDEDHLGLDVDRADREVTELERTQERDRAEDLRDARRRR